MEWRDFTCPPSPLSSARSKCSATSTGSTLPFSPVPNELIYQAAEYKAIYSMSYADCFVLACAIEQAAAIVTGDPDFRKVSQLAKIYWV